MFSCIIPTIWKSKRIVKLVEDLVNSDLVGEIIIIDNDFSNSIKLIDSPKIEIIKMNENIFVNPAWNLGVGLSKFDNIALINDDINFDSNVFELFKNNELKDIGIIGMSTSNYNLSKNEHVRYVSSNGINYGWGCLILFHKDNYVPIPEDLKIWCGDNWLASKIKTNVLFGLKIETEMSTSSGSLFRDIQENDSKLFYSKYKD